MSVELVSIVGNEFLGGRPGLEVEQPPSKLKILLNFSIVSFY